MKKIILILVAILAVNTIFGQDKYYTKNGEVSFEASVASFEEIKAENTLTTAIINTKTSDIAVLALMKGFRFEIALMEEHFNENYVESDEFPKVTFKGKLEKFNFSNLTETPQEITINGVLNLHNTSKDISTAALISIKNNTILLTTSFKVSPKDFNIKIPGIVKEKIAKEIIIHVDLKLKQKL